MPFLPTRRDAALALLLAPRLTPAAPPAQAQWWPHARPLAAVLMVADPRAGAAPGQQLRAVLERVGLSLLLVQAPLPGHAPAQALEAVARGWAQLRRHVGTAPLPLALAGHGFGATLAVAMADALHPAQWPQLLWLLAPGRPGPWALTADSGAPEGLLRPDVALARIDAVCNARTGALARVLLVQGERDTVVAPEHGRAMAAAAPGATLYRVRGAGHDDLLAGSEAQARLSRLILEGVHAARRAAGRTAG
jgi:pimeloyl-ACP methyl ester carboxylesterase